MLTLALSLPMLLLAYVEWKRPAPVVQCQPEQMEKMRRLQAGSAELVEAGPGQDVCVRLKGQPKRSRVDHLVTAVMCFAFVIDESDQTASVVTDWFEWRNQ